MSLQQKKRPHCRACGLPMLGHKRNKCSRSSPVSLPSPPITPAKRARKRPCDPKPDSSDSEGTTSRESSFVIPDPTPLRSPATVPFLLTTSEDDENDATVGDDDITEEEGEEDGGLSMTCSSSSGDDRGNHDEEDNGDSATHRITGDDDDDNGEGIDEVDMDALAPDPSIDLLRQLGEPIVAMYIIRREDLPRIRDAAATFAHHTTAIQTPRRIVTLARMQSASHVRSEEPDILPEDSCLLVMGQNADLVQHMMDTQQREMPGTIDDSEILESPKMATYLQISYAGFIGGMVVVCALLMM